MACTREEFVAKIKSWEGWSEGNGKHKKIIDIYNAHKPLPQGYKVKYTDSWCATTVSAAAIECKATDIIPVECSCPRFIALAKNMGIWVERDGYVPEKGDIVLYDWQDSGKGDNTGNPDHIGVVTVATSKTFRVIEGNKNDAVGYREMEVDGRYIRGFVCPKFKEEPAKETSKKEEPKQEPVKQETAKQYKVTASALNVRKGGGMGYSIIDCIDKGTKVSVSSKSGGWGKVSYVSDGKGYVKKGTSVTGYCSMTYLKEI